MVKTGSAIIGLFPGRWWLGSRRWGDQFMDIGGIHVPTVVTSSAAFGAVWSAFARFDRMQSRTNRRFIGRWLLALQEPERHWNAFFAELFTKFFGKEHFSWKCFLRSITLTLVIVGSLFGFNFALIGIPPLVVVIMVLCGTCVNDYISLGKTRFLLTRMTRTDKLFIMAAVVIADLVTTTILYLLFLTVSFVLFMIGNVNCERPSKFNFGTPTIPSWFEYDNG
jgi:hypothetical protein